MTERINIPDPAIALIERYQLKGSPKFSLDSIIVPVAIVNNLTADEPQWMGAAAGFAAPAQVAGQFNFVELFNPAGSNVVLHATTVDVRVTGGNADATINLTDTSLATLSNQVKLDTRRITDITLAADNRPVGEVRFVTQAGPVAGLVTFGTKFILNNNHRQMLLSQRVDLRPGTGCLITTIQNNTGLEVNYEWEETAIA